MAHLFLVAGAALIVWSWWMVRRGYLSGLESLEQGKRELEAVVEELVSVAEQVTNEMKERQAKLEELCAQSDLRIGRLGGLVDKGHRFTPVSGVIKATLPRSAGARREEPATAQAVPAEPGVAMDSSPHSAVWQLAEQGMEVTDIARVTQRTNGEVQLILGLRKLG